MHQIRFTISVEPEVHAAFQEMAEAAGQSLSRVVGDWLRDTTDSARFITGKMRDLRESPARALADLARIQDQAADETRRLAVAVKQKGVAADSESGRRPSRAAATPRLTLTPPSSPTGVKEKGKGAKP